MARLHGNGAYPSSVTGDTAPSSPGSGAGPLSGTNPGTPRPGGGPTGGSPSGQSPSRT